MSSTFTKSFNSLRIGIAISTYTESNTDPKRYDIIRKSLASLQDRMKETSLNLYVVVVIDGPIPDKHTQLLQEFSFPIYVRSKNGGVARTKNTSIRLLLEQSVDIGWLADDDVLYKPGCLEQYCHTIWKGHIHHMGFCQMHPLVHPMSEWSRMGYVPTTINGMEVMKHGGGGVGCWLSFTPKLIKTIGYFKVMSGKYGYEHINFSHRCVHQGMIPHCSDIRNPLQYIDHIGFEPIGYNQFRKSHSISEQYRKEENQKNRQEWKEGMDKYVPLLE